MPDYFGGKMSVKGMARVSGFYFSKTILFAAVLVSGALGSATPVGVDGAPIGNVNGTKQDFPIGPDPKMTSGALCEHADRIRYPERIAYCTRDVDTSTKLAIIATYDRELGYRIGQMNRGDFKIDHLIPLCAGGGNEVNNLWPQHKSIYAITDPLEPEICQKMAQGRLKQSDAVQLILQAKTHLDQVSEIRKRVNSL